MITDEQIKNIFSYHAPNPDQAERYIKLRAKAEEMALLIQKSCPDAREKSLALTALQQVVMWANASIAINEPAAEK